MKLKTSFQRKIAYLLTIVALLFCLYWVGAVATDRGNGGQGSPGGKLARMRAEVGLSQARLGQIDPTGEAVKLATFGMRTVAANLLWEKAHRYKMKKDWTNLGATVNQITKLQPNFVSIWIFHAWNQSYNISVEFDDVRQRYRWVIRGIHFIEEGTKYNAREPRMPWETGWILSNKIGRADEHRQYRKMFVEDEDFHTSPDGVVRPKRDRDNWLVASEWFAKAEELADTLGVKMKGKGPLIYRSNAPMCLMSYAEAIEKEGTFDEEAQMAWQQALSAWIEYGKKDIPVGIDKTIRLNDKEELDRQANRLSEEIDQIEGDSGTGSELREKIRQEKLAALDDTLRKAFQTPREERKNEQFILAETAEQAIRVSEDDIARRITGANRPKAQRLASQAATYRERSRRIDRMRGIVNFEYWRRRAQMEQLVDVVQARQLVYDANQIFDDKGDSATAIEKYEDAFRLWREVLDQDQFRPMVFDPIFGDDMLEVIKRYRYFLDLQKRDFPEDFDLQDIIDRHA